tara:strand:+ start:542 stop:1012 length:471 start_codon:yes stop_codon:yes gene_type:complete
MNIKRRLLKTDPADFAALASRIALGVVIFPHGAQKLFGWFGGYGFTGTMAFFTETMGIPWIFGFAAIMAESICAVLLILGFLGRINALLISVTMFVAMTTSHIQYGFFMNWFGNQKGEGIEFFLLTFGLGITLIINGSGAFSIDAKLNSITKASHE